MVTEPKKRQFSESMRILIESLSKKKRQVSESMRILIESLSKKKQVSESMRILIESLGKKKEVHGAHCSSRRNRHSVRERYSLLMRGVFRTRFAVLTNSPQRNLIQFNLI